MFPFIGSEALKAGALSRGALRWNYSAMHPDIYLDNGARRDLYVNAMAAWLWTGREGIIAGRAAAALHGVTWIPDNVPIELIARHGRRRPGVIIRHERICDDEIRRLGNMRITTPERTALDLARRLPRDEALEHIDALAMTTGIDPADVYSLADRYRGARGIRAARTAIGLMDGGAVSSSQTRLRLLLVDGGLPRPRTSILLQDNLWEAVLAMGWEGPKVAVEHEDDLRALNPVQRIARDELIGRLGWFRICVHRQHGRAAILRRVRGAIRSRGHG